MMRSCSPRVIRGSVCETATLDVSQNHHACFRQVYLWNIFNDGGGGDGGGVGVGVKRQSYL